MSRWSRFKKEMSGIGSDIKDDASAVWNYDYASKLGLGSGGAGIDGDLANMTPEEQAAFKQQQEYTAMLQRQAAGQGTSPAALQFKQQQELNQRAMASQLASQQSMTPGAAARLGVMQNAQMNQQTSQQAAILRAQEQQSAMQLLGGALGNTFTMAGTPAERALQVAQINMGAQQQQQASKRQMLGTGLAAAGAVIGTIYGGPAGGMAGYQAGKAIGGGMSPQQASAYGSGSGGGIRSNVPTAPQDGYQPIQSPGMTSGTAGDYNTNSSGEWLS